MLLYNMMTSKVYCERCDAVFPSQEKFRQHFDATHSGVSCETCVVDLAISKIIGFFKK